VSSTLVLIPLAQISSAELEAMAQELAEELCAEQRSNGGEVTSSSLDVLIRLLNVTKELKERSGPSFAAALKRARARATS
jgi:hypothetical protein